MADVMAAYLGGLKAGQDETAAQQRQQAFQEEQSARSLQNLVLKHQLDKNKIQDAWEEHDRQFQTSQRAYEAAQGQPAATIPSTPVTTDQPNPTANLSGMVSGLVNARLSGNMASPTASAAGPAAGGGAPPDQPAAAPDQPSFTPAPAAQAATVPVTRQVPTAIPFPGYNGQPGFSRTPTSLEDLTAQAIRTKRAEQPLHNVGPEDTVLQTNVDTGQAQPVYTNPQSKNKPLDEQFLDASKAGDLKTMTRLLAAKTALAVASKDPATVQAANEMRDLRETFLRSEMGRQKQADLDRADRLQNADDVKKYSLEVANGHRTYADALKAHTTQMKGVLEDPTNPGKDLSGKPLPDAPEPYVPPGFDEWQALHPPAARAGTRPAAAPKAAAATPTAGLVRPIAGYPGTEETFRNGKWIRTR